MQENGYTETHRVQFYYFLTILFHLSSVNEGAASPEVIGIFLYFSYLSSD
jgi:hypothetical protein